MAALIRFAVAQVNGGTGASVSLTTTASGNKLLVATAYWAAYNFGSVPYAVASTGGLSFNLDATGPFGQIGASDQGQQVTLWSADAPGGAVTVNVNTPHDCYGQVVLAEFSGIASGSAAIRGAEVASANDSADYTPSVTAGAGTAALSGDAAIAFLGVSASTSTPVGIDVPAAPAYTNVSVNQDGGTYAAYSLDWKNAAAGAQQSASWGTLEGAVSQAWSAVVAVYKGSTATTPPATSVTAPQPAFAATASFAARRSGTPRADAFTASHTFLAVAASSGTLAVAPGRSLFAFGSLAGAGGAPANSSEPANAPGAANAAADTPPASGVVSTIAAGALLSSSVSYFASVGNPRTQYVSAGYVSAGYVVSTPVPPADQPPTNGQDGALPGFVVAGGIPIIAGGAAALRPPPGNAVPPSTPLEPAWNGSVEVFYDDFPGTALDRSKWQVVFGGTGAAGAFEYEPAALQVNNGLTIATSYRDGVWRTGGMVQGYTTSGFAGFQHGQISIYARVDAGRGYGPVFSLLPVDNVYDSEIDILEAPEPAKQVMWTGVYGNPPATNFRERDFAVDATQWHTYTVRWEADRTTFYRDGTELWSEAAITVRRPMTVLLQGLVAAAGNNRYGGAPDDFSTKRIQVAYVRVSQVPATTPPPTAPTPVAVSLGSGADKLTLKVSQDYYKAGAQYTVAVDGVQIGGTQTAVAWKSSGLSDTVDVLGTWGSGDHTLTVNFLNDDWAGVTAGVDDRNLYLDGVAFNNAPVANSTRSLASNGPQSVTFNKPAPPVQANTQTIGTGADSLVLKLTQQPYLGSAQYTVAVDGVQVGGTLTAVALRNSGNQDTITVKGDWAAGTRACLVTMTNDLYQGTPETDRNLYLEAATFNGTPVTDAAGDVANSRTFNFFKPGAGGEQPPPTNGNRVIMGIFIGNNIEDPDPAVPDLNQFEAWLGKKAEAVLVYTGNDYWDSCDPGWQLGGGNYVGSLRDREGLWSIPNFPRINSLNEMRSAARGEQNNRYEDWARKILAHRSGDARDIHVRTCWELGGEWFWWTNDAAADNEAFRGAFRNFAIAFHRVSPRFKIAWDIVPDRGAQEHLYPGDAYVDVISQDVYWHTQYTGSDPDNAFATYKSGHSRGLDWIKNFANQHGKPVAIPEFGVPGSNGNGYNGARFGQLVAEWCAANKALYATYWNSMSAYDGWLSDGNPSGGAAWLKSLYTNGINWT